MVLSQIFKFYFAFCITIVLSTFGLSSFYRRLVCDLFCYDVVLFVILLRLFIRVRTIQTGNVDLINQRYQIMIISMLKN